MRALLKHAEFRAIWLAEFLSIAGDQFARVALSLLVFDRTGSPLWTGLSFAATYLPTLLGGMLLGSLADRFDRRSVMIVIDVIRAVMATLMAIPGSPLPLVIAPVMVISLLHPVFRGAEMAMLRAILPDQRLFKMSSSVRTATMQAGIVAGFGLGGLIVGMGSPSTALLVDAGTFLLSAILLLRVRRIRAAATTTRRRIWHGLEQIARTPRLAILAGMQGLTGFFIAQEAIAAPYAATFGGGAQATGLLLAAPGVGAVLGAVLAGKFADRDSRWLPILVTVTGIPLLFSLFAPGLITSMILWAITGTTLTAVTVITTNLATLHADEKLSGHVMSAFNATLMTSQGVGAALGGFLAGTWLGPTLAITVLAMLGTLSAAALAAAWRRACRAHEAAPVLR